MPKRQISIPLPLPVHFTLLPSLTPDQTLCPLLYVVINDVPIYLTLSPTHQPHFSLLPLLLSLQPPIPPILVLTCNLVTEYSLDLNGNAPFVDLWVPWQTARMVCDRFGVERLFWDDEHPGKGLLAQRTKEAISWDEINSLGHNWMPPTTYIPASSYSLSTLLNTPFSSISLIPSDHCIFTPIDQGRRASIVREAEFDDPSQIRGGPWKHLWDDLLKWTIAAWRDFLLYPSTPPRETLKHHSSDDLASIAHRLLPAVSRIGELASTFSPTLCDLRILLAQDHRSGSLSEQAITFTDTLVSYIPIRIPFLNHSNPNITLVQLRQLETRARVNLGINESVSLLLMNTWKIERERDRLKAILAGKDVPPNIVFECGPVRNSRGYSLRHGPSRKEERKEKKRRGSFEELERRRGGSPPPESGLTAPTSSSVSKQRSVPSAQSRTTTASTSTLRHADASSTLFPPRRKIKDEVTLTPLQLAKLPLPPSSDIPSVPRPNRRDSDELSPLQSNSHSNTRLTAKSQTKDSVSRSRGHADPDSDRSTPLQRKPRRSNSDDLTPLQSNKTVREETRAPLVKTDNQIKNDETNDDTDDDLTPLQRKSRDTSKMIAQIPYTSTTTQDVLADNDVHDTDSLERAYSATTETEHGEESAMRNVMKRDGDDWWVYFPVIGSIIIAIIFGLYGLNDI